MCMKKAAAEKRLLSAEEEKTGKNMDYATKDGPFFLGTQAYCPRA